MLFQAVCAVVIILGMIGLPVIAIATAGE